jgi:hypothetical protein
MNNRLYKRGNVYWARIKIDGKTKRVSTHCITEDAAIQFYKELELRLAPDVANLKKIKEIADLSHEKIKRELFIKPTNKTVEQIPKINSGVYFMLSNNLIKIGFSKNVAERLKALKTGNADIVLLKVISGDLQDETRLHDKFVHLHKTGEWFFATKELKEYINENN